MIKINGKETAFTGGNLTSYLKAAGYDLTRVATELNGDIVPKARYDETVLKDGDSLEVVSFVGGGR